MLTALAMLGALGASAMRSPSPPHAVTEITSAGPGLGIRVAASLALDSHEGVGVRIAPLEVGWEIQAGAPDKPSRFGAAVAEVTYGDWLEARGIEVSRLESNRLRTKSLYVNPVALTMQKHVTAVPGTLELGARLELTFSLWQSTEDLDATNAELLPCSSGSIAEVNVEATIRHAVSLALVAGVSDDPVHFEDGSDCIGGGDVWRSSDWAGARASAHLDHTWSVTVMAGRSFEELHRVLEEPGAHPGHAHVALRRDDAFVSGAWLSASF